jgi:hypothetical protein
MLREVKSVTRQQEVNNEQSGGKIDTLLKLKDRTHSRHFVISLMTRAERRRVEIRMQRLSVLSNF